VGADPQRAPQGHRLDPSPAPMRTVRSLAR
jgi:hypothetical protein